MVKTKRILVADLFCGAGGTSQGLQLAAALLGRRVELTAVNHWDRAIETHSANHPSANHFCQSLADLDPKKAVPGGKLDLLVASPECTHHSVARGGKPVNDQSRASAYCVHRWCAALDVKRVLIENVAEFQSWGPLGANSKPLASGKGKLFVAFIDTLKAMGYRVEWKVLNAADYGGATTRRRLYIQAAKGRLPIRWPARTHEPNPLEGLFGDPLLKWRAAREIIDWTMPGESIFSRKRPLSENTLKRIEAGLRKFGGKNAEPFLVLLNGGGRQGAGGVKGTDQPVPVVTASGGHIALCEPFIVGTGHPNANGPYVYDTDKPLPTLTTCNEHRLVQPFVMRASNTGGNDDYRVKSPDEPLGTIHAGGGSFGLVEPFIVPTNYGEREGQSPRCHDIDKPCPTVVAGGSTHALVEPFVMHTTHHGSDRVYPTGEPLPCVTGANRGEQALVTPFILPHRQFDGMQVDDVNDPMRTITAQNGGCNALVQPFLTPFYANGQADAVTDPLRTVTTKDRFGLCEPVQGLRYDIRFRMLQPDELKQAMGFPKDYKITGNRGEQVKQVGNAVEVNQAAALCFAMLEDAA